MKGFELPKIIVIITVIIAVGIGGGVYFKETQKQKFIIEEGKEAEKKAMGLKSETKQKSVDEIDTSGWRTYRNEEYGFEVKYPVSWDVTTTRGAESLLKIVDSSTPANSFDIPVSSIVVAKTPLCRVSDWAWLQPQKIYAKTSCVEGLSNISVLMRAVSEAAKGQEEQIVLTLKPTSVDTTTWKTYRNEQYRFEVRYEPRLSPAIDNVIENTDIVRFLGQKEEISHSIYVLEKIEPRISHFLSNPECYERVSSRIFNSIEWTVSWFKCGYASDYNHVAASHLNVQRNLVFEIHLSSEPRELGMQKIDAILSTFKFIE